MKSLITPAAKMFKLSFVMIALASAPVFAGGNEKATIEKKHAETAYSVRLRTWKLK